MTGMVKTRLFSEAEFRATFSEPMRPYTGDALVEIWCYVRAVPPEHLEGHRIEDGFVDSVYVNAQDRFHHVLVATHTKNVFSS